MLRSLGKTVKTYKSDHPKCQALVVPHGRWSLGSKFCLISIQLFGERLSYKRGKVYATMSKAIMGNEGFHGCLIEPQSVSAWWKEKVQTRVFMLSRSLLLNHLEPQSNKTKLLLPIMPKGIGTFAFPLLCDNLCRNSYGNCSGDLMHQCSSKPI